MINRLRWYSGVWLLVLALDLCDILDAVDPLIFQFRSPLLRPLSRIAFFFFGVVPSFLTLALGALVVGRANQERIDHLQGDTL